MIMDDVKMINRKNVSNVMRNADSVFSSAYGSATDDFFVEGRTQGEQEERPSLDADC